MPRARATDEDLEPPSHGPKRTDKRIRNRVAQQAFRERHAAYVRDLERRLEQASQTEDEQLARLTAENLMLRSLLARARDDLRHTLTTHTHTLDVITAALGDQDDLLSGGEVVTSEDPRQEYTLPDDNHNAELPSRILEEGPYSVMTHDHRETSERNEEFQNIQTLPQEEEAFMAENFDISVQELVSQGHNNNAMAVAPNTTRTQNVYAEQLSWPIETVSNSSMSISNSSALATFQSTNSDQTLWTQVPDSGVSMADLEDQRPSLYSQLSHIWSHEYQMGAPVYRDALARGQETGHQVVLTNSNFSDHLNAIKECFVSLSHSTLLMNPDYKRFFKSVSVTLSLFNSLARPEVLGWYAPTKYYHHIAGVMMWQIRPCRETYVRLATRYRPTALQTMESYPAIIDWCPFASVRDRLITLHAANPRIDNIICDMATSYVVEANLCELVQTNGQMTRCFVRVWDIIQCMERETENEKQTFALDTSQLPAPSVASLFTKAYAIHVFKKLHMDEGIAHYKLDPAFFLRYGELMDDDHDIIGQGIAISPETQTTLPEPSKLDAKMLTTYKHFTSWSIDVLSQD